MTGSQSDANSPSPVLECAQPYMARQAKRTLHVIERLAGSLRDRNADVKTTIGDDGTHAIMGDHPDRPTEGWNPNRINVRWGHCTAGSTRQVFLAAQWLRSSLSLEFHDVMADPIVMPTKEDPFASLDAIVSGFRRMVEAPRGTAESHGEIALSLMDGNGIDASGWVEVSMPNPFGPAWVWTEEGITTLPASDIPVCGVITASTYGTSWTPAPGFCACSFFRTKHVSIVDRHVRSAAKAA